MSVTFGFYNALNHDRTYDAIQISSIFDGIIRDGVFMSIGDKLMVSANSGLTCNVGTGRAWFNHTWTLNDADYLIRWEAGEGEEYPVDLDGNDVTPETVADRIDAVVLRVNSESAVRANFIGIKKGTPSTVEPQKPTMIHTDTVNEYPLAYVKVNHGATVINQEDIENAVGLADTPFVSGILETVNTEALIRQWADQWEQWYRRTTVSGQAAWTEWFNTTTTADQADWVNWNSQKRSEFDAWFAMIQDILDEDTAGKLWNAIYELQNKVDNIKLIHITINYDPSLAGANIIITNGEESYVVIADISGITVVNGMSLGKWTIIEDKFGTSTDIDTTFYGDYSAVIGGDRFINVEYASAFEGKVITCTDGEHTQTRIATGGRVQFVFANDGLFTISAEASGKTYSTTINVNGAGTYSASLQTTVTYNLTVHSAVNDTVYYYDNGSPVTLCTTGEDGVGNGQITAIPSDDAKVVLYSTIAKATTDESLPYSQEVALDEATVEVNLYPVGALYWYGLELVNFGFYPWDSRYATTSCVSQKNTNNIFTQSHGTSSGYHSISAVSDLVDVSTFNKLKVSTIVAGEINLHWGLYASASTNLRTGNSTYTTDYKTDETGNFSGIREIDITNAMGDMHCAIGSYGGVKTVTTSRMWLE